MSCIWGPCFIIAGKMIRSIDTFYLLYKCIYSPSFKLFHLWMITQYSERKKKRNSRKEIILQDRRSYFHFILFILGYLCSCHLSQWVSVGIFWISFYTSLWGCCLDLLCILPMWCNIWYFSLSQSRINKSQLFSAFNSFSCFMLKGLRRESEGNEGKRKMYEDTWNKKIEVVWKIENSKIRNMRKMKTGGQS